MRAPTARDTTVEALINRVSDEAVLAHNRRQLLLVLAGALLGAVLLGFGIARRELAPLGQLARRVSAIDARSLDQRLDVGDAPREIRSLTASFDDLLVRLDGAFTALSEYSAEMAHELRTPLHVLRQQLEVALGRVRTVEEYRELIGSSLEELERLRRMTDDTLFLARAENPRSGIERAPMRLGEELSSVAEFVEAMAAEAGVSLDVDAPTDLTIEGDRTLVRRALVNVVTNAIKHTPSGGRIVLGARAEGGTTIAEIEDTGSGIPPEALPHIFERYYRVSGAHVNQSDGAGLGLPIVLGIMRLHGGSAEVESESGAGTRVRLRFPALREATHSTVSERSD